MISIIIRTKNEERWVRPCIEAVLRQQVNVPLEVVVVDNASTDKTVEKALAICPDLKLVQLESFRPGKAINEGIRASHGDFIVCLSAHCIPVNEDWLSRLLANFESADNLAGVYGRQVPMSFSSAVDKRDLFIAFGLDRRIQHRDPFFHNANSMLTREVWEKFPFEEAITNIEDRVWARAVLDAGYHIIYEPEAPVFHHHGIHQNNDPARAQSVVRVMEDSHTALEAGLSNPMRPESLKTLAVLPLQITMGDLEIDEVLFLAEAAFRAMSQATYVDRRIVSTDDESLAARCRSLGYEVPFIRPRELSAPGVRVDDVLRHAVYACEANNYYPDLVVSLEITHPFRPSELLDAMIERMSETALDAIVAGHAEMRPCWMQQEEQFERLDKFVRPRDERDPLHVGLPGLACVSLPSTVRSGSRFGARTGIYEIHDPLAPVEVRSKDSIKRVRALLASGPPDHDQEGSLDASEAFVGRPGRHALGSEWRLAGCGKS